MAVTQRSTKINEVIVYNTAIIFSRVMCLISAEAIDIHQVWEYELSPVVPSLFKEYGEGRYPKNKSDLKNALKHEISKCCAETPSLTVIDGCALLWVTHWPSGGTVSDFASLFLKKVLVYLQISDVALIFDRYYDYSTKSCTRQARLGSITARHTLALSSPLPPQNTVLNSTRNKVQLIEILTEYLLSHIDSQKKFTLTGSKDSPHELCQQKRQVCDGLRNTREEADVIIPQQVFGVLGRNDHCIKVVSDDTDVLVNLCHFYHHLNSEKIVYMEATEDEYKLIDIGLTCSSHSMIIGHVFKRAHFIRM